MLSFRVAFKKPPCEGCLDEEDEPAMWVWNQGCDFQAEGTASAWIIMSCCDWWGREELASGERWAMVGVWVSSGQHFPCSDIWLPSHPARWPLSFPNG